LHVKHVLRWQKALQVECTGTQLLAIRETCSQLTQLQHAGVTALHADAPSSLQVCLQDCHCYVLNTHPTDILLMPGASCANNFPASSACCCCSFCRAFCCLKWLDAACSLLSCCSAASAAAVDGFGPAEAFRSAWLSWVVLLAALMAERSLLRFAAAWIVLRAAAVSCAVVAGKPAGLL
jgi:hypothetical protein